MNEERIEQMLQAAEDMKKGLWGNSKTVRDLCEKGYHFSNRDLGVMRRIYNLEPDIFVMKRVRAKGNRGTKHKFFIAFKGFEDFAVEEIRNTACIDRICVTDGTVCGLMATKYCPDPKKARKELRRLGYASK